MNEIEQNELADLRQRVAWLTKLCKGMQHQIDEYAAENAGLVSQLEQATEAIKKHYVTPVRKRKRKCKIQPSEAPTVSSCPAKLL